MVEVRDFGLGFAQASMALAFEPHVRLSHGQQGNRAGTGLGLGIARNIIQAHGGEIRLHNHAEGGLVVTVLLPAITKPGDEIGRWPSWNMRKALSNMQHFPISRSDKRCASELVGFWNVLFQYSHQSFCFRF